MALRPFDLVESPSAARRLQAAVDFLSSFPPAHPITIVAASRGAADDLARLVAARRPATFGVHRLSLTQLAARSAVLALAQERRTPTTRLSAEAVAARTAFEVTRTARLTYLDAVSGFPGFSRALSTTLDELRLAASDRERLAKLPLAGCDLALLLTHFEDCFLAADTADRAVLLATATRLLHTHPLGGAVVLLDVPLEQQADVDLVAAVTAGADAVCATLPSGDQRARHALVAMGGVVRVPEDTNVGDLGALRQFLFSAAASPPPRELSGELELFSAPGEGRESVEIVRRILEEARNGVRFDEMAVLVRSPRTYQGLLEHAFSRARVPAWFDRGTRRPHPAGRAFLALLACASERLSAARFAEYLSLAQVPDVDADNGVGWATSHDEAFRATAPETESQDEPDLDPGDPARAANPDARVVMGTLRAPWRWERLLNDAGVIGRDAERWRRRLQGHERELDRQLARVLREDGDDSSRARAIELTVVQLRRLREFALPIVDEMGAWPEADTWGGWIRRFESLAPRVLRTPAQILRLLADLRPMAEVGPIALDEVRRVLAERLLTLESDSPTRRFGRVFVGTPHQARGRSFRVVFVPGLAERLFPQKPREDPLLLDELRRVLGGTLTSQQDRLDGERLLLRLAVGAAGERLYVSYPRIELSEARARVPSFYALDLIRAATGRVPDGEWLQERARLAGSASLAWPAPAEPADAIDDQEYDLAVLRRLLDEPDAQRVRGHAHYLLGLNEHLRRSVVDRWMRGLPRWTPADGLIGTTARTGVALAAQRLTSRAYSLSALQKFSACPYQFLLSAIYRLQPLSPPEPLQRMDPLTRGSLFHEIQAYLLRQLQTRDMLPLTSASVAEAGRVLDETIERVAAQAHDELAPAVERVWIDEVASIGRDLHAWLHYLARDGEEWRPSHFELAFGSVPGDRDPASLAAPVTLDGGFQLRGAVDLIEEHRQLKLLRVTDHKTGRTPEQLARVVVGGGAVLQPVLYGVAAEAALGRRVIGGRLFYCTAAGSFTAHEIPLNERTRARGLEVLQVIDRAVASASLPAAPADEACQRCDYRVVCGPGVRSRVRRKPQEQLADVIEMRSWS